MLTLTVTTGAAFAGAVRWPSGAVVGAGGEGLPGFAAWRGAPVQTATDYLPSDNWAQIEDPSWAISQWAADRGVVPDLSVALWPWSGGSLAEAASGAYNAHFVALAQNLVAGGLGSVGGRLGGEFNGTWYRGSVGSASGAALFAQAWRQIVGAMRSVPGANFSFDWCPNLQAGGVNPALAYPGDAYVSDIGMDVYDWDESGANELPWPRWNDIVNKGYGLAWQASFAAAHRKPIAFPEWGLVSCLPNPAIAGGDDPMFVQNMFDWFTTHNVAFENYFDVDVPSVHSDYGITTGSNRFPNAAGLYHKLYSPQYQDPVGVVSAAGSHTRTSNTHHRRRKHRSRKRRSARHRHVHAA